MYARSKLKIQKAAACNHSSNMIYIFEYLQRLFPPISLLPPLPALNIFQGKGLFPK